MLLPCLSKNCYNVPPEGQAFCVKCLAEAKPKNAATPSPDPVIRGVDVSTAITRIRLDADRISINGVEIKPPPAPASSRVGRRHTDRPPESIPMSEKYPKYYKRVPEGVSELDIYAICQMFPVEDATGCINHARKKLLIPGTRTGGKSMYSDIKEARDTLNRWLELNAPATK